VLQQINRIIRQFESIGVAILKPLGNKAGEGIFCIWNQAIAITTHSRTQHASGQVPIMVSDGPCQSQKGGDKQIILLNG